MDYKANINWIVVSPPQDRFNRNSYEDGVPDTAAICKLAEWYSELIELYFCSN